MRTITAEQFKKTYGDGATEVFKSPTAVSFGEDTTSDIKQIGTDISSSLEKRKAAVQASKELTTKGAQSKVSEIFQTVGQAAGFVSDIFGSVVKGGVKAILPQKAEDAVKETAVAVAEPIVNTDLIKGIIERYNSLDEVTKKNLDATLGIGSLALDVATAGAGKKAGELVIKAGTKGAVEAGELVNKTIKGAKSLAEPIIDTGGKVVTGAMDTARTIGNSLSRIPSRIGTNVAEKRSLAETISQLPTQTAKTAVSDGVDLADIKYLYSIPTDQKAPLRDLLKATKEFETGASKTNPIEIVGKPIVQRLKELDSARSSVGKELGEVSQTLGDLKTPEIFPRVFNELKSVSGLSGLKVNSKGVLDFSDTVLATRETMADRKAIQSIFTSAVKGGTGKQKHLLRQELFESLGGKKKSLTTLTDTQSKAYEAIRKGLANVLDSKNSKYKELNQKFARIAQPISDIRKFMKDIGASEDVLDMSAGLLARRLTSNSASNPQIRAILRAMDEATAIKGKSQINVVNLQDFYNVLDKYYNIAGKTSFQGQVTAGLEKTPSVKSVLVQTVGDLVGQTDAVKRKALEDALAEALR